MLYTISTLILSLIVLVLAVIAIIHKNITVAIIAMGTVGLFTSVIFLLLAAPDVAMTEAAIGSGLTTVIFFYVLNKIKNHDA
jgi:uncharacterized MnhB-related membrane protein